MIVQLPSCSYIYLLLHLLHATVTTVLSGECEDLNDNCDAWSVTGECDKNAAYMVGSPEQPGACLKACGRCDILKKFREQHQPEATATQRKLSRRLQ